MNAYTATTAAEISDFVSAEIMINGTAPLFHTNDKATGVKITVTAATLMSRVRNAAEVSASIREGRTTDGAVMFEIHNGDSVYGRYIAS